MYQAFKIILLLRCYHRMCHQQPQWAIPSRAAVHPAQTGWDCLWPLEQGLAPQGTPLTGPENANSSLCAAL